MANRSRQEKKNKPAKAQLSEQAQTDAQAITDQVSKPSFNKQQRKEVHQAIQQGIERYKQQHSAKARNVDKQRKKYTKQLASTEIVDQEVAGSSQLAVALPWLLLVLSWCGFVAMYVSQH